MDTTISSQAIYRIGLHSSALALRSTQRLDRRTRDFETLGFNRANIVLDNG